MKESLWGYYLILLGITVSTVMILVSNMTTTNQQDYYLLREVTRASMIDSVDYGYYRTYGEVKINTEKFVENFLRRFSESISKTNTYKIDFYSIYENPPSVSIKVTSNTGEFHIEGDSTNIDVINSIDAILESNNVVTYSQIFYSVPYAHCDESNYITKMEPGDKPEDHYCQLTNRALLNLDYYNDGNEKNSSIYSTIQEKVGNNKVIDSNKIKIQNVEFLSVMSSNEDLNNYKNQYVSTYKRERTIYDIPEDLVNANYLAKYVKDINITAKKGKNGEFYLAYGLKFNCEGVKKYKYYRTGDSITNMVYSDEKLEGYSDAPFNDNCLVGIKYRINFYYDENA